MSEANRVSRSPVARASYSSDDLAILAAERSLPRRQSVATVHHHGRTSGHERRNPDRWATNGQESERRRHKSCREIEDEDEEEERRSRAVLVCASVAVALLLTAILLVAVTLTMSPAIDEMVRKENEEILRELEEASSGGGAAGGGGGGGDSSSSAGGGDGRSSDTLANGTVPAAA